MGEATHTSGAMYSITIGRGRGHMLWAGKLAVSDANTLDTGLDTIEGLGHIVGDADIDANTPMVAVSAISAGIITFITGEVGDYTNVSAAPVYLLVAGTARGI